MFKSKLSLPQILSACLRPNSGILSRLNSPVECIAFCRGVFLIRSQKKYKHEAQASVCSIGVAPSWVAQKDSFVAAQPLEFWEIRRVFWGLRCASTPATHPICLLMLNSHAASSCRDERDHWIQFFTSCRSGRLLERRMRFP